MEKLSLRTLKVAHQWVAQAITPGDSVIDATVGNGHDTVFLAQCVGEHGRVYGFDLQEEALVQTRHALTEASQKEGEQYLARVFLQAACHSSLQHYVKEEVSVAMFNLGYLPSSDKSVITQRETTLEALRSALAVLKKGGVITIVCYPGHAGGQEEAAAVDDWARALSPAEFTVLRVVPHNPRTPAPYLLGIQKGR